MPSFPSTSRPLKLRSAFGVLGVLAMSGCYLPIPYLEATSPALVGDYRRSDGTPAAGRPIAVSTAVGDAACSQGLARSVTDSMGRFALRASQTRHRGMWVIPAIEKFGLQYHLCVGVGGNLLRSSFDGIWSLNPKAPPDTLACIEGQRAQVQCTARGRHYVSRAASPPER